MNIFLDINAPGWGLFSIRGTAILFSLWVLVGALHPFCLAAVRASDAISSLMTLRSFRTASEMHGLDCASVNTIASGFLMRGEATLAGYALFSIGLIQEMTGAASPPFSALFTGGGIVSLVAAFSISMFLLSSIVDSTAAAWKPGVGGKLAGLLNLLAYGSTASLLVFSSFSVTTTLWALAAGIAVRSAGLLVLRGVYIFGVGAVAWAPMMIVAWATVTAVIGFLGPVFMILRRFSEEAFFASIPLGSRRELQISDAEISLPRCYGIDSVCGMKHPR